MKLSELTNEEVLFMYFSNRKWLDVYEDIFKYRELNDRLDILDVGFVTVTQKLEDSDIERISESRHYKLASNVEIKLYPLVDMIQEADADLYNSVVECFKKAEI
jgi:hypothetical protein